MTPSAHSRVANVSAVCSSARVRPPSRAMDPARTASASSREEARTEADLFAESALASSPSSPLGPGIVLGVVGYPPRRPHRQRELQRLGRDDREPLGRRARGVHEHR